VTPRRLDIRELALRDLESVADHYIKEGGEALAMRFVDTVATCLQQIGRSPLTGSLQFTYDLGIPELRARPVGRFPSVVFYVTHHDHVDIWRVLHSARDVSAALSPD
jgi:toxin ParE1/3/4